MSEDKEERRTCRDNLSRKLRSPTNGVSDWCGSTLPVNCLSITNQIPSFRLCGKETWRTLSKVVLLVSIALSRNLFSVFSFFPSPIPHRLTWRSQGCNANSPQYDACTAGYSVHKKAISIFYKDMARLFTKKYRHLYYLNSNNILLIAKRLM